MDSSPDSVSAESGLLYAQNNLYLLGHVVKKYVAFFLGQVYGALMSDQPFKLTSDAAKKLSKLGASKGGEARANNLSSERRSEIARAAVEARWAKAGKEPLPRATHKGSFNEEFGADVDCYVLDDERKTAVISQTGMGQALGLASRGNAFPRFLASKSMAGFIGAQLSEKIAQPLRFQWGSGGALGLVHGFDATLLIDVCKAIIAAESQGRLNRQQLHVAQQAHIILGASAKAGIQGLVYALAGYDVTKEEVIQAFKLYVQEEARKYESEFPPALYMQWHNLYEIPVLRRGKPWQFKHLTVKHVYYPLAKSNGKIFELLKALKAKDGDRKKKLFQFLNEIGARALSIQLGRILEMAESSANREQYEKRVIQRFGGQQELDFMVPYEQKGSKA